MNQLHNEAGTSSWGAPQAALDRLFELTVVLGEVMDAGLADRGLTRSRAEILWRLRHHDSPMTQRELSQALRCTPRNVTGLLDALQAAGLVARSPHPTDRRATQVSLTDRGAKTADQMRADQHSGAEELFSGVSTADLTTVATVVETLLERLRAQQAAR